MCSAAWLDAVMMMLALFLIISLEISCRPPSLFQPALFIGGGLLLPVKQLGLGRHDSKGMTSFHESIDATLPTVCDTIDAVTQWCRAVMN